MLDVAHMAIHIGQLTGRDAMRRAFDCITTEPAKIIGLENYGLEVGCNGDLVILQARDPIEAIRLKATRLAVVRRGRVVARTAPRRASLQIEGRQGGVDASLIGGAAADIDLSTQL
jgi:cytosine deaminase